MKKRLSDEGNETVTNCNALKMTAADGKQRLGALATLGFFCCVRVFGKQHQPKDRTILLRF
jgi:hypothetical protein